MREDRIRALHVPLKQVNLDDAELGLHAGSREISLSTVMAGSRFVQFSDCATRVALL